MNTFCTRGLVVIFWCVFLFGFGQNDVTGLGESAFALDHKLNSRWSLNYALKSRYFVYDNSKITYDQRQLDLAAFSSYKLDLNRSLSFGVQYRNRELFNDTGNELRLTQQFNIKQKGERLRYGHRFRFEQRIFEDLTLLRSRYRFALDFPLNGQKLDVGETYLVTSMEALLTVNASTKPEMDHRTTAQLGWLLSEKLKLQVGLEYRFEAFNLETEQSFFLLTSGVLKI